LPIVLAIVGIFIVASAVLGNGSALYALLLSDFKGNGNFIYWVACFIIIGSIGTIKTFQAFSNYMMALILIVLILANGGLFTKLQKQLQAGTQ